MPKAILRDLRGEEVVEVAVEVAINPLHMRMIDAIIVVTVHVGADAITWEDL